MPTKKPRVMIVMEEDTYNTFMRFKTLTGKSLSSVLSDVVSEVAPAFSKLCDTFEAASKMDREAKDNLISRMSAYEASLNQTIQEAKQQDWVGQGSVKKDSKPKKQTKQKTRGK